MDTAAKVLEVSPDPSGTPPKFSGSPGSLDDRVAQRMREVYLERSMPAYLDPTARKLLAEGRLNYARFGLDVAPVLQIGPKQTVITPWRGTIVTETLALALIAKGLRASPATTWWSRSTLARLRCGGLCEK